MLLGRDSLLFRTDVELTLSKIQSSKLLYNYWIMTSVLSYVPLCIWISNGAFSAFDICLVPFSVVVDDFKAYNICINNCVYYEACDAPTSVVIISQTTGSRTIIHSNKNLPELTLDDFKKLDLSQYSWIHFEASYLTGAITSCVAMQKPTIETYP